MIYILSEGKFYFIYDVKKMKYSEALWFISMQLEENNK